MEGKTLEEMRKSIALVIAMADVDYKTRRDAERDLDSLIVVISQQLETKCKEALMAQGEGWKKELTRQVNSAMECGRAEGAEQEREKIRKEATTCDLVVKESIGRDESGNEILSSNIEKVYAVSLSVLAPKEKP